MGGECDHTEAGWLRSIMLVDGVVTRSDLWAIALRVESCFLLKNGDLVR